MNTVNHIGWELKELAILYHLVIWGKSSKEVNDIVRNNNIINRSESSISGQISDVRKWVSQTMGYPVGEPLSRTAAERFNKASRLRVDDRILRYKPLDQQNVNFKPTYFKLPYGKNSKLVGANSAELITSQQSSIEAVLPKETNEQKSTVEYFKSHPNLVKPKPTIIELVEAAKAMGAKEVEYEGMIIRF